MVSICYGLYEDQIGLFDWKHKSVGTPKQIVIDHSSPAASKRIFVITEHNVLAALNARTGQILWRKVFEPNSGMIHKIILSANSLLTISGNSQVVRAWDASKGSFLWESNIVPSKTIDVHDIELPNVIPYEDVDKNYDSVLLSNTNYVKLISKYDGSDIWEYSVKENYNVLAAIQSEKSATVISLRVQDNKSFVVLNHLNKESGKLVAEKLVPGPWLLDHGVQCVVSSNDVLVCLNPTKNFLASFSCSTEGEQGTFMITPLENFKIPTNEKYFDCSLRSVDKEHIEVKIRSDLRLLAKVESETKLKLLKIQKTAGLFTSHSLVKTNFLVSLNQEKNSRLLNIDFYDAENLKSEPAQRYQTEIVNKNMLDDQIAAPILCSLHMYKMKEDFFSFRMLLVSEDLSVTMLQSIGNSDTKVLWRREESLATVTNTKMIELPPAASAERLELLHAQFSHPPKTGVLARFANRVKSQIRQIQTYAEQVKKQRQSSTSDDPQQQQHDSSQDEESLTRDQFNIQKIILINTAGRRLFGIRSQNGQEVWSAYLPAFSKNANLDLIEQRSTAHFPLPPQSLLLGKCDKNWVSSSSVECKTVVYAFNPVTGEGLTKPAAVKDFELLQTSVLPFEDEKSSQVIGIVDTELNFHIFPDTPVTRSKLSAKLSSLYIYLANTTNNLFRGYQIAMVKQGKMELFPVWSVAVPSDQKMVQVSNKRSDEVVNSVGRVLGDHTVLYKYLNPNLVGLMAVQGEGAKGSLFVYIIDAVTGHIVYNVRHNGGEQPIQMILSEHWLLYLYHNAKSKRNEVSVVEMYEGYEENNSTAFSSLDPVEPSIILSQSYILPANGVNSMVATATERGITNKNILFGLSSGYVVAVPKMFFDPRREFKQTKMLQEEGVPPYMPELPIFPQAFVNYNKTVDNIRGIYTAPAGLESTCLVLVYGLDLFFTRVTPSKMFDVLKEDFDYIFISGVLSALILVSFLCSKFASMKNLRTAWT